MVSPRDEDLQLLRDLLASGKLRDDWREAFEDMLDKLERHVALNDKMRAYAQSVADQIELAPRYENLVSSGQVPRGKEVALLVHDKPIRPPTRKDPDA